MATYTIYANVSNENIIAGASKDEQLATPPSANDWWDEVVDTTSSTMTNLAYSVIGSYYRRMTNYDPDKYEMGLARTFLRFNTSSIAEAEVISSVKLYLHCYSKTTFTDSPPSIVVQKGEGCHYPFEAGDFDKTNHTGNYGERAFADLPATGQWFYIDINAVDLITKEGDTLIVLKTDLDLEETPPERIDTLAILDYVYLSKYPTYNSYLVIETETISVTTQAVTNITYDYGKGNGTITSSTNATERGFEVVLDYGTLKDSQDGSLGGYVFHSVAGFDGTVTYDLTYDWNGTLTKTITEEGDFAEGVFTGDLAKQPYPMYNDTLFKCESYTCRAYAIIGEVTYYGEYVEFDTTCDSGDDQQCEDDISDGDPCVPIIPIEPELPELPPFEWEEEPEIPYPPWDWDIPPYEIPDYPPMSFVGDFYYRKPYTKKDLDYLRKKCIIYNKNSVEFALVLRHNMNVLKEFFNMMTDYMDKEEFNDFTDLIPPQRLKELYLDPLEPTDFRDMINGFIRNTVDNNMAVNRNFGLIQDGLSDYETGSDDAHFRDIVSNMKQLEQDNPDVERMKKLIDNLNFEVASNFSEIMYNLKVVRARLL